MNARIMYALQDLPYQGVEDLSREQLAHVRRAGDHEMARRGVPGSLYYILFTVVLILATPLAEDHPRTVYSTLAIAIVAAALRAWLYLRFDRLYDASPHGWVALHAGVVLGNAAAWSAVNVAALHRYGINWVSLWTVFISGGICAGALSSMAMRLGHLRALLVIMLLPPFVEGLRIHGHQDLLLGFTYATYLLYGMVQARYMNREYWEARINTLRADATTRQRLHELTYHDSLTGLPNRELFYDRLQQAIFNANRDRQFVGVLVVNLDRFKKINDTLGHQAGDALLKQVARQLRHAVREADTVARLGADTFAIVLPNQANARVVATVAQKLLDQLREPMEIAGLELVVASSIGIAVYPTDDKETGTLLSNAEAAMFGAKEHGGNNYQYYEACMNAQAKERLTLETRLRRALERDEFVLHYQPKVDLMTGRLTGLEALLRWCPAGADPVFPATFIPLLEDTGLIVPVGEWVLRTACRQNKSWQDAGLPPVQIAVNLSARQFREPGLAELVTRVLDETGLESRWLELEITESMVMHDTEQSKTVLGALSAKGITLSIDDFGTGYSSLAYLKRLPIDTLKIDRSFVKDITTDANDAAVVRAVIAMAHSLRLRVIAEGTETAEQVLFLRSQSCDEMQGYFFSRPIPPHEVRHLLEEGYCVRLLALDTAPGDCA